MLSREYFLTGKINEIIFKMSWPTVLAVLLYGFNNFLDIIFVGKLIDSDAMSAVGISYPLSQIILGIGRLIGVGTSNIISKYIGNSEKNKLFPILGVFNFFILFSYLVIVIPMYLYSSELLSLMGAKGEILKLSVAYFRTTLVGGIFWVYGLGTNMLIRGEGKMKKAAGIVFVGLVIDIILKPIMIKTLGLGVVGAAWSTNIGMMVYSILGFYHYYSEKASFSTNILSIRCDKNIFFEILKLGGTEFILTLLTLIQSVIIFNSLVNYGSDDDLSFYAVLNRFLLFSLTPLFGLMRCVQPLVGINLGAKNYIRVKKIFTKFVSIGTLMTLPLVLVSMFFPQRILFLILPEMVITEELISFFIILTSTLLILPTSVLSLAYLPAINKSNIALFLTSFRQLFLYIPLMLFLPMFFGVSSIYWGVFIIEVVVFIFSVKLVFFKNNFMNYSTN